MPNIKIDQHQRKRRKVIRGQKNSKEDDDIDKEGNLYDPGACDYK